MCWMLIFNIECSDVSEKMRHISISITFALCILVLICTMPVAAADFTPLPQGEGSHITSVKFPTEKEVTAALGSQMASPPSIPVLKTPKLISPADGVTLYNYPRTILLQWQKVDGATGYQVDYGWAGLTKWAFYPTATLEGQNNCSYSFEFIADNPGCWRVTAIGNSNNANSNASAFRLFYYDTRPPTLSTPKLVSPVNNLTFWNYPRWTQLTWKVVPGATGYDVQVQYQYPTPPYTWDDYPAASGIVSGVLNTNHLFRFVGSQPGRMRVRAVDQTGSLVNSTFSEWRTFKYMV